MNQFLLIITLLLIITASVIIISKKNNLASGISIIIVGIMLLIDYAFLFSHDNSEYLLAIPIVFILLGVYFIFNDHKNKSN